MTEQGHLTIDPNMADVETLTQLPGIGPVLAQRIVEARPLKSVDDLVRVQGIGAKMLNRLRPALALDKGEIEGESIVFNTPGRSSSPAPFEEIGPATFPVVAKAPETTLLPAFDPKEPEEDVQVKEHESALNAAATEATEADVVEPDVVEPAMAELEAVEPDVVEPAIAELEAVEPDVVEPAMAELEAVEPDAVEPAMAELEAVEPDVVEAKVVELEGDKAEVIDTTAIEEEAAPWETEPIPSLNDEELPIEIAPRPQRPAVTRARVRWMAIVSILLATLLGTLLSLGLLNYINGGQLQFATPGQVSDLSTRAEGIQAQAGVLAQDVEGLRKRLDNLEALSGRLGAVEQATEQTQADLKAAAGEVEKLTAQASDLESQAADLAQQAQEVEARVGTLEAQGSRAQAFLEGLSELMNTLFPPEASTK